MLPDELYDPHLVYKIQTPIGGSRVVDPVELGQLILNPTNSVPELNGRKTWISNYVGTFWVRFMGPVPFAIYFQLMKMAYGEKDYAYPSIPYIALLLGISERTVQRNMDTLKELQFVHVLERKDTRTNKNLSNLYLLASTIPFLTTYHYDQLPQQLKDEHKKFMDYIKFRKLMPEENIPNYEKSK